MNRPTNIRNVSVITHVNHGKSTITDSLIAKAGIIHDKVKYTDKVEDEKETGITTNSTGISLSF